MSRLFKMFILLCVFLVHFDCAEISKSEYQETRESNLEGDTIYESSHKEQLHDSSLDNYPRSDEAYPDKDSCRIKSDSFIVKWAKCSDDKNECKEIDDFIITPSGIIRVWLFCDERESLES